MAETGILYVVLHGLITLVRRKGGYFHGFFVDMKDEHEYLAGSWLNERPIPSGAELELPQTGLVKGSADLDKEKCLLVDVTPGIDSRAMGLRRIRLPLPAEVHHLFTDNVRDKLDLSSGTHLDHYNMSAVTVFKYGVSSFEPLICLMCNGVAFWSAVALKFSGSGQQVAILHLYNMPRNIPDDAHLLSEFEKGFTLLGPTLKLKDKVEITRDGKPVPCQGLKRIELHDLAVRERVVNRVSQLVLDPEYFAGANSIGGSLRCVVPATGGSASSDSCRASLCSSCSILAGLSGSSVRLGRIRNPPRCRCLL